MRRWWGGRRAGTSRSSGTRSTDPDGGRTRKTTHHAPLAAVVDPAFTWGDDRPPRTPWHHTIIYELHVKGFTAERRDRRSSEGDVSRARLRRSHSACLHDLGVTAVELMPVHFHLDDLQLVERGLSNYWGYNTLAYFRARRALRDLAVADRSGARVQDDGARAARRGPRGHSRRRLQPHRRGQRARPDAVAARIDNLMHYRLNPTDLRRYEDFTGCGNTLNMRSPRVLQLIMDSLRYWVLEMHVDGFRFDLASALARELHAVDKLGAFFDIIHQDPILSQVKLIAEPWDLGEGGYQVGNFPTKWTEWNGKYRDTLRRFWRGEGRVVSELGTRLAGSNGLYMAERPASLREHQLHHGARRLHAGGSRELRPEAQRGQRRSEPRRRAEQSELELRDRRTDRRRRRDAPGPAAPHYLASLLLSQGVPMISGGRGRPHAARKQQRLLPGQRNQLDAVDAVAEAEALLAFTRRLIALGRRSPRSIGATSFRAVASEARGSRTSCGSTRPGAR